jgi:Na+/proline symporter
MMNLTTMAIVVGVIIGTICLVDAYKWNRISPPTLYKFFLLDGALKLKGFVSTILAANLSHANFLILIASFGYAFGLPGLIWLLLNLVLNVVGYRLFFHRFRSYIEDHSNSGTIHDYLSSMYAAGGSYRSAAAIRLSASVVTVLGLLFAIVFELNLAVDLINPSTYLKRVTIFIIFVGIICLFTVYGGFKTLITSGICQSILLSAAALSLFLVMLFNGGGDIPVSFTDLRPNQLFSIGWPTIVGICIIGPGWLLVTMDQWQRVCASRSYDTSKRGVMIYLPIISCFAIVFGLWGMYDKSILASSLVGALQSQHSGGANPLADILLLSSLNIPTIVINFIVCGLIAAGLSTANTLLNVSSHSLTTDVLLVSLGRKSLHLIDEKESRTFITRGKAIVIALGVAVVLSFAFLQSWGLLSEALIFFFITYSIQVALLAPMVMTWFDTKYRPSANAALISIAIGLSVTLIVGFGSWLMLLLKQTEPILSLSPSDWLTLTPVITFLIGLVPLIFSALYKRSAGVRLLTGEVTNKSAGS